MNVFLLRPPLNKHTTSARQKITTSIWIHSPAQEKEVSRFMNKQTSGAQARTMQKDSLKCKELCKIHSTSRVSQSRQSLKRTASFKSVDQSVRKTCLRFCRTLHTLNHGLTHARTLARTHTGILHHHKLNWPCPIS